MAGRGRELRRLGSCRSESAGRQAGRAGPVPACLGRCRNAPPAHGQGSVHCIPAPLLFLRTQQPQLWFKEWEMPGDLFCGFIRGLQRQPEPIDWPGGRGQGREAGKTRPHSLHGACSIPHPPGTLGDAANFQQPLDLKLLVCMCARRTERGSG